MTNGNDSVQAHFNADYHKNGDGLAFLNADGGLTKREYFAAKAMQGIISTNWHPINSVGNAKLAIEHADALIAELNKNQ